MLLYFGDRTRTGVFNMVWSLTRTSQLKRVPIHKFSFFQTSVFNKRDETQNMQEMSNFFFGPFKIFLQHLKKIKNNNFQSILLVGTTKLLKNFKNSVFHIRLYYKYKRIWLARHKSWFFEEKNWKAIFCDVVCHTNHERYDRCFEFASCCCFGNETLKKNHGNRSKKSKISKYQTKNIYWKIHPANIYW